MAKKFFWLKTISRSFISHQLAVDMGNVWYYSAIEFDIRDNFELYLFVKFLYHGAVTSEKWQIHLKL